ncbi:hypothetical protein [Lysinibacillus endophyticus]|nr:hypothetical protein [Lysinibacillus endophyticus]MCP1144590.1 hypothetical protein [Lysinibacillus endophyticus]
MKQQQGMIFNFKKENGQFIHTFCEGKLVHRIGLTPKTVIGKALKDIFPLDYAEQKGKFYH